MASKKKESEGIAFLSMYGDEDDDMEEDVDGDDEAAHPENRESGEKGANEVANMEEDEPEAVSNSNSYNYFTYNFTSSVDRVVNLDSANDNSKPVSVDNSTPPQPAAADMLVIGAEPSRGGRKGTLTIVDYGHDEAALSPEAEEGEIAGTGRVMFGAELQIANGTPPGTVQLLTPSTHATPQSSEQFDSSQSDAMDCKGNGSGFAKPEEAVNVTDNEPKEMDPLEKFLSLAPMIKCSDELQEKIVKFLLLRKNTGRSFNSEVRNRKEYRNPDFLLHAVTYQDIDQIGSCFSKDVFDPHGYDKSDYYDEIEVDIKRELERKEQEKKRNQKIEFLSGAKQSAAPTIVPVPAVPVVAGGGPNSVSAAVGTVAQDGSRLNKKSKWDKVDGDGRRPLSAGGQESFSSIGTHAALVSAANAGTGYTAFAQERRREAEERRSSDRKLDRRS